MSMIYHIPPNLHHPGYRRDRRKCGNFIALLLLVGMFEADGILILGSN